MTQTTTARVKKHNPVGYPKSNARVGDKVLYRENANSKIRTGVVVRVGLRNSHDVHLDIEVQFTGRRKRTQVCPFHYGIGQNDPCIAIFPPATEVPKAVQDWAKGNKVLVAREPNNSSEIRYRFIDRKLHTVSLRTECVETASFYYDLGMGWHNGKWYCEDNGLDVVLEGCSESMSIPDGFEAQY